MADEITPNATGEIVTKEQTPVEPSARDNVYEKYARLYPETGTPGPNSQAPAQPVEPAASQPTPPSIDSQVVELVKALQNEVASLKTQITKPVEAPKPVVEPTPTTPQTWVDHLRQGEFEKAEQDLVSRAKAATTEDAVQRAVAETLELIKIKTGVETYLGKLRADNPEIVPMERYLVAPVEQRIEAARKAGQIKSADDFLKIYQEAIDAEVSTIRNISQQYRAAGKNEAMTTQKTVLSASTLSPQAVSTTRDTGSAEPQVETTSDYLAKRLGQNRAMRGLAS